MICPDNPQLVSLDFCRRVLEKDPPGTWLAQPKYDGWRRVLSRLPSGTWTASAKNGSEGHTRPLPKELMDSLSELQVAPGTVLDAEWMGPRRKDVMQGRNELFVFDLLALRGSWLRGIPFLRRYAMLFEFLPCPAAHLAFPSLYPIPPLDDAWEKQLSNPMSEGLVIRRADSGLVLAENKCAVNPLWFKVKKERKNGTGT